MLKDLVTIASACALGLGYASAAPALKSMQVELPRNAPAFPGRPGADVVNDNCLTCHSSEMVLMQPALSKDAWAKEVTKMRKVYGAQLSDGDVPKIIEYLGSLKPSS